MLRSHLQVLGLPIPAGPLVDLLLIARGFLIVDVLFITSVSCMHDVFSISIYLFLLG